MIKVTISEPRVERNGGFFDKALYSYRIVTSLIEKGYNPEDLSNFVIKKSGIPMEHLNFEQLEQMI